MLFVANDIDKSGPAATNTNHLIALAERAEGNRANSRVQAGDVAAAGENSNYTLLYVDVSHVARIASTWSSKQMIMRLGEEIRKCKNHNSKIVNERIEKDVGSESSVPQRALAG